MLLKLLKKYNIEDYYFIYYEHYKKGNIITLVVEENPLEYIDILNKEILPYFNCKTYKVPLTKYPRPYNSKKISPRQARKWAKEHIADYCSYVQEQEESNNINSKKLKNKVNKIEKRPTDFYI